MCPAYYHRAGPHGDLNTRRRASWEPPQTLFPAPISSRMGKYGVDYSTAVAMSILNLM